MAWKEYKQQIKEAITAGDMTGAEELLRSALEEQRQPGGSEERMCVCLDQLAWIYVGAKEFQKARDSYQESMEIKKKALGMKNPLVARACKKVATVAYMQEKFDQAEVYAKEALNIFTDTLGSEDEETQQTLIDLAALLRKIGRSVEADILERRHAEIGSTQEKGSEDKKKQKEEDRYVYEDEEPLLGFSPCRDCGFPCEGEDCPRCNYATSA